MSAPQDSSLGNGLREKFISAMRRRSDTVHVVVYRAEDGDVRGLTATAVVPVSADPPTMLVCVHRDARSHADIEAAGEVSINIASAVQQPIAERLARPGANKTLHRSEIAPDGFSVANASASMHCSIDAAHAHGTHTVFVVTVNEVSVGNSRVLQYHDGQFHEVKV